MSFHTKAKPTHVMFNFKVSDGGVGFGIVVAGVGSNCKCPEREETGLTPSADDFWRLYQNYSGVVLSWYVVHICKDDDISIAMEI
ncbi:hypothetical protein L484_021583 [Morus notabilis]|uniref:Uncharacterized protein n=1 Tax=Morus notabilis TaxID=981085 RepID=W9SM56_9ROSA|nr:hypothetical protein L484_021583 [Morus notabilis]